MEPLKEMFNKRYYEDLARKLKKVEKGFDDNGFLADVLNDLDTRSLNERMRNTSVILKKYLPGDYEKTIGILKKVIQVTNRGYTNLVFPDFVGLYGHDHFELSMEALNYFTTFGSSEFAIREFLKRDFQKTLTIMYRWSKDKDPHVRRLASEGSRPRLPWSFKLDEVIKHPEITTPILENLKADNELYVRKSVANHLNDISKENSEYMLKLIKGWDQGNPHTAWITKHASRTLIKKGHASVLSVFAFEKDPKFRIEKFKVKANKIKLGEYLEFEFDLISDKTKTQKLVIDFIIHYQKSSGALAPKVFKLKEVVLDPKQKLKISKKHLFKNFTTRTHFAGKHILAIQINGKKMHEVTFYLNL